MSCDSGRGVVARTPALGPTERRIAVTAIRSGLVSFLAAPGGAYMTGSVVTIDGGRGV